MHKLRHVRGLTLIELLVTLSIMALLAVLSWRALDGMSRTQQYTQNHSAAWLDWQTVLAQWSTDLDALQDAGIVPVLDYNGKVLRMVRRDSPPADNVDAGLRVVAWTALNDPASNELHWARWTSPPLKYQSELLQAWAQAQQWGQASRTINQNGQLLLMPISQWEVFYHRGASWSNPLSASGTESPVAGSIPDGIRLVITLPPQGIPRGKLTKDWVRPSLGGGKAS